MKTQTGKISMRQALIIFVLFIGSNALRIIPSHSIEIAERAAWLSVIIASAVLLLYFFLLQKIFNKYKNASFIEIVEDIFGKIAGWTIGFLFFLFITLIAAHTLRNASDKLSSLLSVSTSSIVFIGVLVVLITFFIKYDVTVFARLCEILLFMVIVPYTIINLLALTNVSIENFYPISAADIIPVLKSGYFLSGIWGFVFIVFIFSDRISDKKNTFRLGVKSTILLAFLTFSVIFISLGILGPSAKDVTTPYIAAIQTISLFDSIERVEAFIVAVWIFTDFAFLMALILSGLHALRSTFKLSNYMHFKYVYVLFIFFLSIFISDRAFEMGEFGMLVLNNGTNILGFGIPFLLFVVGKIRRKI